MRTLVIANDDPWPEDTGSRIRLAMALRGLTRLGPVDLCSLVAADRPLPAAPPDPPSLDAFARVGIDPRPLTGFGRAAALRDPSRPRSLPRSGQAQVSARLARFVLGRYDLVWYFTARAWVLASPGMPALPTVVDLDDLEDRKIAARLAARSPAPAPPAALRRAGSDLVARDEIGRWQRLYRSISASADAVALCSELDAGRAREIGVGNAVVVPNGAPWVDDPGGRPVPIAPPTLLFQGFLRYPPNIEAARSLVMAIAPLVRRSHPGVRVRLVGEAADAVRALDDPPAVTVTGRLPDLADELARASAVVVPLRVGSGTRVKILEAFAHRVPVVATPLAAEGLDVEGGRHLLVGTSPEELAAACVRLLGDAGLGSALAEAARRRYEERYSPTAVGRVVAELAASVAGRGPAGPLRGRDPGSAP